MDHHFIESIHQNFEIDIPVNIDIDALRHSLAVHINHLIEKDFEKLVRLLYRIDVYEEKLKTLLKENPTIDAGSLIADMIIERQLQKIKTREQFKQEDNSTNEDEKW
jgi:hypothetical protein